jgi:ABC-2 type transport system permease protein
MKRYAKLYLHFLRFSFIRAMQFRLDFSFRILMDFIFYAVNILFFKIIYLHTPLLAGMTEEQMMIFVASYLFLDSLIMTFLANNIWMLPTYINKGDLDYYLVRPVSSLFFLSLRDIAANSTINMLGAFSILVWCFGKYSGSISLFQLIIYSLFILNGLGLYYLVRMMFVIPVFWTHTSRGLDELFWGIEQCMQRPVDLFRGQFKRFLTTIIPLGVIVSFPVKMLFTLKFEGSKPLIIHMLLVTIIFGILFRWCWKLGLKNYSSASS